MKSLESALDVRSRILSAFEAAELETDPERATAWLTFVVVGAGPTGVEMAGQIAELARDTLRRDFRTIDPRSARILLVEAADRVLPQLPAVALGEGGALAGAARRRPCSPAATVVGDRRRRSRRAMDEPSASPTRTVIWAAGVTASGLARELGELTGAERDRAGRVTVEPT